MRDRQTDQTERPGESARAEDAADHARSGAGVGQAAFPVGVLAGAAVGGVGGALVGDETPALRDEAVDGPEDDAREARRRR